VVVGVNAVVWTHALTIKKLSKSVIETDACFFILLATHLKGSPTACVSGGQGAGVGKSLGAEKV
jgi:hypothetical protein